MTTTYERLMNEKLGALYGSRGAATSTTKSTVAKEHKIENTKPYDRSTATTAKENDG